jgi:hypothetical protein
MVKVLFFQSTPLHSRMFTTYTNYGTTLAAVISLHPTHTRLRSRHAAQYRLNGNRNLWKIDAKYKYH